MNTILKAQATQNTFKALRCNNPFKNPTKAASHCHKYLWDFSPKMQQCLSVPATTNTFQKQMYCTSFNQGGFDLNHNIN